MHALSQMPLVNNMFFEREQKTVYMYLDLFSVCLLVLQFFDESISHSVVSL